MGGIAPPTREADYRPRPPHDRSTLNICCSETRISQTLFRNTAARMHSGQLEKTGSLRKRTLSRGMSEEESLRHIIREAEETGRHLTRSDSRYGSLRRGQRQESHSEDDLFSENLQMVELRASYEDCVQELRTLELQQEALLFQVDCLQDALEGTEEMLAEAQRETHHVTAELERERQLRRTLELTVASLTQEMQRLREEENTEQLLSRPAGPVWLQGAPEGTSVDRDEAPLSDSEGSRVNLNTNPPLQLKIMGQTLSHHQKHEAEAGDDNDESSGYEDAPSEFSPSPSTPDEPADGALLEGGEGNETRIPKNAESCSLS